MPRFNKSSAIPPRRSTPNKKNAVQSKKKQFGSSSKRLQTSPSKQQQQQQSPQRIKSSTPNNPRSPQNGRTRNSRNHGTLQQQMVGAVVCIAVFHYLLLVVLYHGFIDVDTTNIVDIIDTNSILEDVQSFVGVNTAINSNMNDVRPNGKTEKKQQPTKILWMIESENTEEDKQRRNVLRRTYLQYSPASLLLNEEDDDDDDDNIISNLTSSSTSSTVESIFCSIHDVQAGNKLTNTNICVFYYVFVIRNNGDDKTKDTLTISSDESDIEIWNFDNNNNNDDNTIRRRFTNYVAEIQQSLESENLKLLTDWGWVSSDTMVFPSEVLAVVSSKKREDENDDYNNHGPPQTSFYQGNNDNDNNNKYILHTPTIPIPSKCQGCLWDQESTNRRGRLLISSIGILNDAVCSDDNSGNSNFHDILLDCILETSSTANAKNATTFKYRIYPIGHQYQGHDAQSLQRIWDTHTKAVSNYQYLTRKSKVYHIVGIFERPKWETGHTNNHHNTKNDVDLASFQTLMTYNGLLPKTQFYAYGSTAFPRFISQDYRWEEHIEFMFDTSLPEYKVAGYGFWRGALIEHHYLTQAKNGDFIVFADSDMTFTTSFLSALLEHMLSTNTNLAVYQMK